MPGECGHAPAEPCLRFPSLMVVAPESEVFLCSLPSQGSDCGQANFIRRMKKILHGVGMIEMATEIGSWSIAVGVVH